MSNTIEPPDEAVRRALRWIARQRLDYPDAQLSDLLEEAGFHFDLTPIEQEGLRALLTPVLTEA